MKRTVLIIENFLRKVNRWMDKIETALVVSIITTLLVLSGAQILLRKLFHMGVQDLGLLVRNLVSWLALLGAALAAGEHRHISIDLTDKLLSGRAKKIINLLVSIAVVWVSFLYLSSSVEYISWEYTSPFKRSVLGIPEWSFSLIFPLGFLLILYHYAANGFFIICELVYGEYRDEKTSGDSEVKDKGA